MNKIYIQHSKLSDPTDWHRFIRSDQLISLQSFFRAPSISSVTSECAVRATIDRPRRLVLEFLLMTSTGRHPNTSLQGKRTSRFPA